MYIEDEKNQPSTDKTEKKSDPLVPLLNRDKDKSLLNADKKWNAVKASETTADAVGLSGTRVDVDGAGLKAEPYKFGFNYKKDYKPEEGFMGLFKDQEPVHDKDREANLAKLARVNALGDLMKHIGTFAGAGYAPVERRRENQQVLKAIQDMNNMREQYYAKVDKYKDKKLELGLRDYADQREEARRKYNTDWGEKVKLNDIMNRARLADASTNINKQYSDTDQYKNKDLIDSGAQNRGGGSGKDESFTAYIKNIGDIKVSKDAQIQVGARIINAMLRAKRINEKDVAGLLEALKGVNSIIAFRAAFDNLRYTDVWEECKSFIGHGIEIIKPETVNGGSGKTGTCLPK